MSKLLNREREDEIADEVVSNLEYEGLDDPAMVIPGLVESIKRLAGSNHQLLDEAFVLLEEGV